ncbi:OLC1v1032453C1 [Oldenlandia corymbosa var. corymbosa]|uniref:OLC1v1032453C1 n=1 Tax=Oldenlandia corymbosa var. corymbosa TaxID=529605 RepID=A0AAV1CL52_OLDCO|nr:OLC1v1032453C1 [Oldenlandia corymbosa var. corymbosa]
MFPKSHLSKFLKSLATLFALAWKFFSFSNIDPPAAAAEAAFSGEEIGEIRRVHINSSSCWKPSQKGEEKECSICLFKMEQGDEIRELKNCGHEFHRDCIDRWVTGHGQVTCPLCRSYLRRLPTLFPATQEIKLLVFKFCNNIGSTHRRHRPDSDSWWLR